MPGEKHCRKCRAIAPPPTNNPEADPPETPVEHGALYYGVIITCVIILAIVAASFLTNVTSPSAETYTFVTKWGSKGTEDGQFYLPIGVAVDSSGNVYVTDSINARIQKFSSTGTFITKWGSRGTARGQFEPPGGIAVDPIRDKEGGYAVYVADTYNNRIQKFSSEGTFLTKWGTQGSDDGQFQHPFDVAVDSSENVYVADQYNLRIQKFSSTGTFLLKWGTQGSDDGQFQSPGGVAVDPIRDKEGGYAVYVADTYNNRIQKFNSNGTFITKWGSQGSGDGQFSHPWGVAIDSSGNVYVADEFNDRIQKFSSDGTFLTKWGGIPETGNSTIPMVSQ